MPTNRKFEITDARRGAAINIRVVTQAERTELAGIQEDGALKVRLMADSAGDAAANKELLDFLAARLGVAITHLEIVAGASGREKIVSIEGLSSSQVEELINNPRS
jgi:uncharacterized protein (TIGR00251 family)